MVENASKHVALPGLTQPDPKPFKKLMNSAPAEGTETLVVAKRSGFVELLAKPLERNWRPSLVVIELREHKRSQFGRRCGYQQILF
jgi:hypothetical protein